VTDKPLCIDLFCLPGGWTNGFLAMGFRVIGFNTPAPQSIIGGYQGELVLQDVMTLDGHRLRRLRPRVIVAGPPCTWFSLARTSGRDPARGMVLVREAMRVIREADPNYWCIENVRGAYAAICAEFGQPIRPGRHNEAYWFWGNIPIPNLPLIRKTHTTLGLGNKTTRGWDHSRIPLELSVPIAEVCLS